MPLFETFTSKHTPKIRLSKMRSIPTTEDLKYALAEAKRQQKPVELPFKNPANGADFIISVTLGVGVAPPRWVFEREDAAGTVQLWTRETLEVIMIQGKIKVESMYAPGTTPPTDSGQNLPAVDPAALQAVSHSHLGTVAPEAQTHQAGVAAEQAQTGSQQLLRQSGTHQAVSQTGSNQPVGSFIGPQRPNFGVKERVPSPFDEDFDAVPVDNWLGAPRPAKSEPAKTEATGSESNVWQTISQEIKAVPDDSALTEPQRGHSPDTRVSGKDAWATDQEGWGNAPDPLGATGPTLAKPENIDRAEVGKVFQSLINPETGLYTPEAFKFLLTLWCEHAHAKDQPLCVLLFEFSRNGGSEVATVQAAAIRKLLAHVLKPFDPITSLREHEFALLLYGADNMVARKFSQVLENALCESKAGQHPELADVAYHCGVSLVTSTVRDPGIAITTAREAKEMARKSRMSVFVFS